jgi:hypothetical protein
VSACPVCDVSTGIVVNIRNLVASHYCHKVRSIIYWKGHCFTTRSTFIGLIAR